MSAIKGVGDIQNVGPSTWQTAKMLQAARQERLLNENPACPVALPTLVLQRNVSCNLAQKV